MTQYRSTRTWNERAHDDRRSKRAPLCLTVHTLLTRLTITVSDSFSGSMPAERRFPAEHSTFHSVMAFGQCPKSSDPVSAPMSWLYRTCKPKTLHAGQCRNKPCGSERPSRQRRNNAEQAIRVTAHFDPQCSAICRPDGILP